MKMSLLFISFFLLLVTTAYAGDPIGVPSGKMPYTGPQGPGPSPAIPDRDGDGVRDRDDEDPDPDNRYYGPWNSADLETWIPTPEPPEIPESELDRIRRFQPALDEMRRRLFNFPTTDGEED